MNSPESYSRPTSAADSSFPRPLHPDILGAGRPSSAVSSRMTDIASEDGDEYRSENLGQTVGDPGARVSVGAASTRPSTAATGMSSQRGTWSQSPPSRRGHLSTGTSTGAGGDSAASTGAWSARPPTATSRTHVPSLTSHAFFRPMSSQRLQAQRGRPVTGQAA